jgi:NAD(P)-dependent dehydrogenase (short-subunit alcohol dehydrogenase family)
MPLRGARQRPVTRQQRLVQRFGQNEAQRVAGADVVAQLARAPDQRVENSVTGMISSPVTFLASDDAVYITGAELAVDGDYLPPSPPGER